MLEEAARHDIAKGTCVVAARPAAPELRHEAPPPSPLLIAGCSHIVSTGLLYDELGGEYFRCRDPEKTSKRVSPSSTASDTTSSPIFS